MESVKKSDIDEKKISIPDFSEKEKDDKEKKEKEEEDQDFSSLENLEEGILNQFPTIVIYWLCSLFLAWPAYSWWQITAGIVFMYFWIHTIHRLLHEVPTEGLLGLFNTHMKYHHQPKEAKPLSRPLELFLETFTDLGMNLLLLGIQIVIGIHFVPPIVILFFTLSYMSIHIVNYSIFGSETHKRHHLSINKNFGPDTIDHIMGTNFDESWEDTNHTIPNSILVATMLRLFRDKLPAVFG